MSTAGRANHFIQERKVKERVLKQKFVQELDPDALLFVYDLMVGKGVIYPENKILKQNIDMIRSDILRRIQA